VQVKTDQQFDTISASATTSCGITAASVGYCDVTSAGSETRPAQSDQPDPRRGRTYLARGVCRVLPLLWVDDLGQSILLGLRQHGSVGRFDDAQHLPESQGGRRRTNVRRAARSKLSQLRARERGHCLLLGLEQFRRAGR
jgi:hypothetical protein